MSQSQSDTSSSINLGELVNSEENVTNTANKLLQEAKSHLSLSGNLKTSIKDAVTNSLNGLYNLVVNLSESRQALQLELGKLRLKLKEDLLDIEKRHSEQLAALALTNTPAYGAPLGANMYPPPDELMRELVANLRTHSEALEECKRHTTALTSQLKQAPSQFVVGGPSFAEMAARRGTSTPALHSVVVSSSDAKDTSDEVINKIRTAVNARTEGVRVERLRKAKDQKVIIGFGTKAELDRVKAKIQASSNLLQIEDVKNKDPLVMLREVMAYNTDEDIVTAIKEQNAHLLSDVATADIRVAVKYRRRTRNPHMNHVVLQVSPPVWNKLIAAEKIHVDLQRVSVFDQSPLVQCSTCLGYGHSKKYCKESTPLCSHCGEQHLRADCPSMKDEELPRCRNCVLAKNKVVSHNAFAEECPIRKKWDSLARSTIAYC